MGGCLFVNACSLQSATQHCVSRLSGRTKKYPLTKLTGEAPVSFFTPMARPPRIPDRHRQKKTQDQPGFEHTPRKRFGQNFLTDRNILNKIVRAAGVTQADVVLEIGPGLGHLTHALAETGAQVAAVELDRDLLANLRTEFSGVSNIHLLEGNILDNAPDVWLAQADLAPPYIVVANIPYYITSPILRYLLEAKFPPVHLVVMVQREVAQHMLAKPPRGNLLGTSIQYYGTPRLIDIVPAGAFFPRPQVDSAIVRIDVGERPEQAQLLFRVVRAGFGSKRKQLVNALANGLKLSREQAEFSLKRAGIDPMRRAETIGMEEWKALATGLRQVLERMANQE